MLRIYTECQEGWSCGVLERDLERDDPPIHLQVSSFDLGKDAGIDPARLVEGRFFPVANTLIAFARAMLLRQTVLQPGPGRSLRPGVCGASLQERETGRFRDPLTLRDPFGLAPALTEFPPRFLPYANADLIVAEGEDRVVARTPGHLGAVAEFAARYGAALVDRWAVD